MALTVLFMIFASFQLAAPASAAKVVDHGTKYSYWDDPVKFVWKTYQYNNNFVKVYATLYYKSKGKYVKGWNYVATIAKVTPTTVKIREWNDGADGPSVIVTYKKTSLTSAQYYWRLFRPDMLNF